MEEENGTVYRFGPWFDRVQSFASIEDAQDYYDSLVMDMTR